jgi:hypothetical protein
MYRMIGFLFLCCYTSGCANLRFAPSEAQKKNAWLHTRAAAVTAQLAKAEKTSENLQALSSLSEVQSRALSLYYGLPKELPQADTAEDLLKEANYRLAGDALEEAAQRPAVQNVIDSVLELAIGISALLGGVYGTKAVQFFGQARAKSQALREIIAGNELFKKENEAYSTAFKKAQEGQSCQTRQIVAELKG